jgi:hypothetical protein
MASRSSTSPASTPENATSNDKLSQDELTSEHLEELATGSETPEDYDKLCELCGSLNIESLVSDYGSEGKLYDLDALVDSASRCKTCERLFDLERLRSIDGVRYNNSVRVEFQMRPRVGGCCGALKVYAKHDLFPMIFAGQYTAFTNEGDIASSKYGLLPLHTVGSNTSSAESFNTARKWLRNCIEGHQDRNLRASSFRNRFGQSNFETGVGPARLIDVFAHKRDARSKDSGSNGSSGTGSSDMPGQLGDEYTGRQERISRIVDRVDVLDPYLALSYKWGTHPYQSYITTNANLLARMGNILEHELPKTFRHAIHIARSLGVRYLRIDAVCIIQDSESAKDWLQESEKMGSIFANALLTLVAAGSEHSEEGMFNNLSTYGKQNDNQCITLHTVSPGSDFRSTLHFVPTGFWSNELAYKPHRSGGPLLRRAWCLQEDLLLMRKLYYARDQLYWECDHLAVSEDDLADPELPLSFAASSSPSNIEESESAWRASIAWYKRVISLDYSRRVATKATDRLVAVAGLARHLANTVKSRYLAGLWEVSVLQGLLWQTRPVMKEGIKTHCAPSWSWASQEVETEWMSIGEGHGNFVPGCEYSRAHIDLSNSSDLYGGVVSGTLTIRSKVVEIVVEVADERQRGVSASCEGVRGWVWLDENMNLSDTRISAVPVLDDVSLLVTKSSGSHTYRRVGLWRVPSNIKYSSWRPSLDTWDVPAEYLRWRDQVLPTIPVTEITIE